MTTELITNDAWPSLTKAIKKSRKSSAVAVAYFGAGASRLLPLSSGSRLVVDASERAVKSGQTCPAELLKLLKEGVRVYSVPNLHAKVFVVGRAAFIGSTNVSSRSASQLVEALVRTNDNDTVRDAREFVRNLCLHELTPAALGKLKKLYRPPKIPGGSRANGEIQKTSRRPTLPRVLLAQLWNEDLSDWEQGQRDAGYVAAKKNRKQKRNYELDDFHWTGHCPFRRDDVVIQVVDEGGGRVMLDPPGNVLHVRSRKNGRRRNSFVYLELPVRRRRQLKMMTTALGRGAKKRLSRNGLIREFAFAQSLLKAWTD